MPVIEKRSITAFLSDSMSLGRCSRCEKEVPQTDLFSEGGVAGQGNYAVLGQVIEHNKIVGGLVCGQCASEFTDWWRL